MMTATREQLTMVSVVAASNLPARAFGKATCIIHLVRNTFRMASKRDWDALRCDVKPIYTAVNEPGARAALELGGPPAR